MRNEVIHCPNETMYRGNRVWLGWSRLRLSFSFLIEVCDMARIGMTGWSDIVNALEQNLSSVGIATLSNVFLSDEVFYHLSSPSRYLTKNILSLVIQIWKLFYFGLKFSVKSVYKSNTLCWNFLIRCYNDSA